MFLAITYEEKDEVVSIWFLCNTWNVDTEYCYPSDKNSHHPNCHLSSPSRKLNRVIFLCVRTWSFEPLSFSALWRLSHLPHWFQHNRRPPASPRCQIMVFVGGSNKYMTIGTKPDSGSLAEGQTMALSHAPSHPSVPKPEIVCKTERARETRTQLSPASIATVSWPGVFLDYLSAD